MKDNFLNNFGGFEKLISTKTILTYKRTVCILHSDGRVSEHHDITDPWKYIAKVKKSMDIKSAWIKEE